MLFVSCSFSKKPYFIHEPYPVTAMTRFHKQLGGVAALLYRQLGIIALQLFLETHRICEIRHLLVSNEVFKLFFLNYFV